MTRARSLSKLSNPATFTVDTDNNIGVNSTIPKEKLNIVGVVSATSFFGDGSSLSGITGGATLGAASGSQRVVVTSLTSGTMTDAGTDADFAWNSTTNTLSASNINVSGTLTYEDVTNVDSLGIVTARTGIKVTAGGIDVVGGGLTVTGVSTFSDGINVVGGGLTVTGVSTFSDDVSIADKIIHTGDTNTAIRFPAADTFTVETGGIEALRVDSSGRLLVGTTTEGFEYVDNFTIADSGNCGITIRSGATSYGSIYFSDATSGGGEYIGVIEYNHNTNVMKFNAGGGPKLSLNPPGEGKTAEITGNLFVSGVATATAYHGDGSNLTGISVGLSTEAFTSSGIVTAVRLSTAQDHKITATGFTTITSSGDGTEGESHTIRIINSGIATVGFSTYFLFPSGAAPSLPTADGAISLISFTVHDSVGAGCTQLLAGASVNFS